MSPEFDVRTAYFLLGVLSLGGSLGVHASLYRKRRRRHQTWVAAGLSFGLALMLIAFRGQVPEFVTYELTHFLLVGAFLLHASALQAEVGRGWSMARIAITLVVTSLSYTLLTSLDRGWGLMFNALATLVGGGLIVWAALSVWRRARLLPALVIALGFGLVLASLVVRIATLLPSAGQGGPFEPGTTQVFLMMGALFAVILGHLGYLGLQFQRMAEEQVETERAAAMEVERSHQARERAKALHDLLEERNQLIQRIARSEAANDLALFATSLPHELSQPLCAVKLNIDCLKQALRASNEPALRGVVQAIETGNDRVLDLLQQLRILLQTQEYSGGEILDLRDLVGRTLPILEGSFGEHRVRLVSALAEGRVEVQASATQMQQLLLILCAHALDDLRRKPPPPGQPPQVRVSLAGDGRQVCLRVEDSGARSSVGSSGRLPGQGATASPAGSPRGDRLGAGLTVALRVAQAHQGQLEIEDSPLGGTAFVLTLPPAEVLQAAGQVVPPQPGPQLPQAADWARATEPASTPARPSAAPMTPPPRQTSPS